jgi:hypothetical protein
MFVPRQSGCLTHKVAAFGAADGMLQRVRSAPGDVRYQVQQRTERSRLWDRKMPQQRADDSLMVVQQLGQALRQRIDLVDEGLEVCAQVELAPAVELHNTPCGSVWSLRLLPQRVLNLAAPPAGRRSRLRQPAGAGPPANRGGPRAPRRSAGRARRSCRARLLSAIQGTQCRRHDGMNCLT